MRSLLHRSGRAGRFALTLAAAGLAAVSIACVLHPSPASGQATKPAKAPPILTIFRGDNAQASGLALAAWGSGSIDEDTSKVYNGSESLRIVTHGLYQGASLVLNRPVDLGPYLGNKYAYLQIALIPPPPNTGVANNGPGGGGPGGLSGSGPGGLLGGGQFGPPAGAGGQGSGSIPGYGSYGGKGGQGPGTPGSGGGNTKAKLTFQKNRNLLNLRVVLVTGSGRSLDVLMPLSSAVDDNQWKLVSIPVAMIPSIKAGDTLIKEVRVFGDAPATINVGSISVVEDSSPITVDPISDKTAQARAEYPYRAVGHAGITPLVYSWDWDASDGIQDETQGRVITHIFRRPTLYNEATKKEMDTVVTVTVSDLYGIKPPARTSFRVHVTP
jgi:hypothetical protein